MKFEGWSWAALHTGRFTTASTSLYKDTGVKSPSLSTG